MFFTFSEALRHLKEGHRICRSNWNGKGMWLTLVPELSNFTLQDGNIYVMQPFIAMKTVQDTLVPWLASQTDILADDWQVFSIST